MADPIALTVQTILGPFDAVGNGSTAPLSQVDFVWTASQGTDGNTFVCTGREIILAQNTNVGDKTITIVSVDDETNRSENIGAYTMQTLTFSVFGQGLTLSKGWMSAGKTIRINTNSADVLLAVLRLPAGYP